MKNLTVSPDRFLIIKDDLRLQYAEEYKGKPLMEVREVMRCILDPKWHVRSLLQEIDSADLTLEALENFIPILFERMNIHCLAHGSISREWATTLPSKVQNILSASPLRNFEVCHRRTTKLPQKSTCIYAQVAANREENNSAIEIYYQIGAVDADVRTGTAVEILSELIWEPFFSEIRTKQQLGYVAHTYIRRLDNVTGLSFLVQSSVTDPDDLERRIEIFLEDFGNTLVSTSNRKFSEFINAAKANKLERDKNLTERSDRFWKEIRGREYWWSRKEKEVEALSTLTLNDVEKIYANCILRNGKDRRKLVVKVYGGRSDATNSKRHDEDYGIETLVIKDIVKFRKSMGLWPAPGKLD